MSDLPLEELPKNWRLERLDHLFKVIKEPARIDDEPISAFIDGVVTLRSNRPDAIIKGSGQEIGYKHIEKDDLVISGMNAHLGGLGISDSSGKCTPVYTVMRKIVDLDQRFISYYLWHAAKSGYIKSLVNAVRYNSADFGPETVKRFMVPLPPLKEQTKIADYLEVELKTIANLESRFLQLHVLCNQFKKSLIYEEINSYSSENNLALGKLCNIYQPQTIPTAELHDDGKYPVYGANGIIGRYIYFNHIESQLLLTCRGGTCGEVNVSEPYSWINGNAMVIKPKSNNLDQDFLKFVLMGWVDIQSVITGSAQPQITGRYLNHLSIPVPEMEAQLQIVSKLNTLVAQNSSYLKLIDENMANVIEFRTALISEAVTGKLFKTIERTVA